MRLLSFLFVFCAMISPAMADEVAKLELIERLEAYKTISASFEQRTYKDNSIAVDVSEGQFQITKPMKFNWQVVTPFEQQVISDGETLWVYDPDLEQATYQAISDNIDQSPAMILAQPRRALADFYDVRLAANEELTIYRLMPRDTESVFDELRLIFTNNSIDEIRIKDSLGQETVLRLSDVEYDLVIDDAAFEFTPPPGTDLFEQAQ